MSLLSWLKQNTARDDAWITVHPNASGKGSPVLLDDEGYIKGGMGGKFTGQRIDLMPRKKQGLRNEINSESNAKTATSGYLRTDRYSLKAPEGSGENSVFYQKTMQKSFLKRSSDSFHKWIDKNGEGMSEADISELHKTVDNATKEVLLKIADAPLTDQEKEDWMGAMASYMQNTANEKLFDKQAEILEKKGDLEGAQEKRLLARECENLALFTKAEIDGYVAFKSGTLEESPASIGGAKLSAPMSHEQANERNANPFFIEKDGALSNCQTCVAAYEMRLRGYNVRAKLSEEGNALRRLAKDPADAWIDRTTGRPPEKTRLTAYNTERLYSELDSMIRPGERGNLEIQWQRGGGHIITVFKDQKNNVTFYDPQSGETRTGLKEISDSLSYGLIKYTPDEPPLYFRVDNAIRTKTIMDAVLEEGES